MASGSPFFDMRTLLNPLLNSGDIDYYTDLYWSGVGPHHERASYNLLYLVDAHASRHGLHSTQDGAPYRASSGFAFRRGDHKIEPKDYATMPGAKRAARAWVMKWLASTGGAIEWTAADTGVHFVATADGLEIGSYYHNPEKTDHWHQGFRAHFGMTYYREDRVRTPDEAKAVIAQTWGEWLRRARERFLVNAAVSNRRGDAPNP